MSSSAPVAASQHDESSFPIQFVQPKNETQALDFINETGYDGDGVVVAVFDTGVDPGTIGLSRTPNGKPKILDIIDGTGSGDVDTSTVVKATIKDGVKTITGLSGRELHLSSHFDSPNDEYRIGVKAAYSLFPEGLEKRVKETRKKQFDEKQRLLIENLNRQILLATATSNPPKTELEARLELAKSMTYNDPGPIYDVVLFKNSEGRWKAAIDTSQSGDLTTVKPMGEYRFDQEYGTLSESEAMLNYSFNVYNDGNVLSIVTNAGSHGTHVASIIGAYHPNDTALNGVAPGCQIISIKIGDHRLGSMETGVGLVRAIIAARNHKVDIINMSYGEPSSRAHCGRFVELANELVQKHGIIFVASAGNNGPNMSTVGAPGGYASEIIGIGAAVTPAMTRVQYSMRQPFESSTLYNWSSRGPVEDGGLGVSICAPGGAITGIPNWTLSKSQLMNGTSMSSPNAAGCIALILSGLKANNIPYSPWLVRRALENTADPSLAPGEPFSCGYGMIQVVKAYEWLKANKWSNTCRFEAILRDNHSQNARGLYLREPHQFDKPVSENIEVTPYWNREVKPEEKINFEKRILIKTTSPDWISVPEFFVLNNATRSFNIHVNPQALKGDPESGSVFTGFVVGLDAAYPNQGPLFSIPITCIKPVILKNLTSPRLSYPSLTLAPAKLYRKFIVVPEGASFAEITLKGRAFESRLVVLAVQHFEAPHVSTKFTRFDKYIRIEGDVEKTEYVSVTPGRTVEVVVGQYWSSLGDKGTLNVDIRFRGFQVDTKYLTLSHFEEIQRVNARLIVGTSEQLQPMAKLAVVQRSVYPASAVILPLSADRDKWNDERQVYQLINTYSIPTWEGITKYICRIPNLSGLLYDSPYESQFWMVYDENKRCVASGDAWPEWFTLEKKGNYICRVQFRHDDLSTLEKFKNYPLLVEGQLAKDKNINLNIFHTHYQAVQNGHKFTAVKNITSPGIVTSMFVSAPTPSSLPSFVEPGDNLLGIMTFVKLSDQSQDDEITNSRGVKRTIDSINLRFSVPQKPKPPASSAANDKSTSKLTFPELQSKFIIDHLNGLVASSKHAEALKLADEVASQIAPRDALLLKAIKLRCISATVTDPAQRKTEVAAAADEVIKSIDQTELAAFFGIRHTSEESEATKTHEDTKKLLIEALKIKVALAAEALPKQPGANTEQPLKDVQAALAELRKWADTDAAEFIEFNKAIEMAKGNLAACLKLVRKELANSSGTSLKATKSTKTKKKPAAGAASSSKDKSDTKTSYQRKLYEAELELLRQIDGFGHWVSHLELWMIHRFPKNYQLF